MENTLVTATAFNAAVKAIRYMRENDCDFLTVANVQDYSSGVPGNVARRALRSEMGAEWYERMCQAEPHRDYEPGQVTVQFDGREFAVIKGRRWTRIREYLSNGQLTARFFVDEATGEIRDARSWKAPGSRMGGERAEFVRGILAAR